MSQESHNERITIDVALSDDSTEHEHDLLRAALTGEPRALPSRYFYDDRGSTLFEQICEQPEYYQTRTEKALLARNAALIVERTGASELMELGAGAATKTRVLLDAMDHAGRLQTYLPVDVSEGIVRRVAAELISEYPTLRVHGIVANFLRHLSAIPTSRRTRLVAFLGGTIGNLRPDPDARRFLRSVGETMRTGDALLLGTDLIKSTDTLNAAYNDAAGITAEFNLNILSVINERFDADFDAGAFRHRAFYNESEARIEMWLDSTRRQSVHLAAIGLDLDLEQGESLRTEISAKYDEAGARELLAESGFCLEEWLTDEKGLFALSLARRVA